MKVELSVSGSLEGSRSLAGSNSTAMEAANPRPSPDAAESLVDEQTLGKTDPDMAHVKLRRATEQINLLEGKLQQALNENAKLKVKQTEDAKLWQGLDFQLSSTKILCDQLTETLQQLASQIEQAEEDKKFFEEMLGKNSKDLDEFNCLFCDLSTKLDDAEQKIISGRQEMLQIKQEKEEMDRNYKERLYLNDTMIKEKDSLINQLEGSVEENKSRLIYLDSRLQCMEQKLNLKDDVCISLKINLESSEREKNKLELMNNGHALEIENLCQDNKDLKELLSSFVVKVTELDEEHASVSSHVSRLISSFESLYEMAQEEKMLMARSSKDKFEHLQSQYVDLMSENKALKTEIEELKSRLIELQRTQEIIMVQHVEEWQLAEDKTRRLDSEAEVSASKINQLEKLASELQGRIQKLLEDSTLAKNHKKKLLQKILNLESDDQELLGQAQSTMVDILENQINQLRSVLDEKEHLYRCSVGREKTLEDQKLQVEASLSEIPCQLSEAKKQYNLMLESAKIELSKHLKELYLKNDQVINEIHKKYELEKIEITNAKKEKADKLKMEIESQCKEKLSQNKLDFERYLIRLKEEYSNMVERIQQDYELKEATLRDYHKEVLQHWSQDENERLSLLRKDHEKECLRMKEELELQKSKEDNMWDKRQIIYLFVLTSTVGLVFILQPLLPAIYNRRIIMATAAVWGIGSIGLPCGMFGTSRLEKNCSRYTGRAIYTLFSVFVIYGFYLVAMRAADIPAPTPSSSLQQINEDTWETIGFCAIGVIVFFGNLCSSIMGVLDGR